MLYKFRCNISCNEYFVKYIAFYANRIIDFQKFQNVLIICQYFPVNYKNTTDNGFFSVTSKCHFLYW